MKRDFKRLLDITAEECRHLLDRARFLKELRLARKEHAPLKGMTLAMIFEKASTRTRISFEVGMGELGGQAIFLSQANTQMGRGEPVRDTARVLSRYVHGVDDTDLRPGDGGRACQMVHGPRHQRAVGPLPSVPDTRGPSSRSLSTRAGWKT